MISLNAAIEEYQRQLQKGTLQTAYQGLMQYMLDLRTHFKNKFPQYSVPGSLYYGYMDMTYFSVIPEFFKQRNLKIAIVFVHEACRFEIWLAGYNKQVQQEYWQLMKESDWNRYPLVPTTKGYDSIVEHVLADHPNFDHLDELTCQIEKESLKFISDIEDFLARYPLLADAAR